MYKYQLNLISKGTIRLVSELGEEKIEMGESLILYQNENYKIGNYRIIISNSGIESVIYSSKKFVPKDNIITIEFDFNNVEAGLKISFKNGLADDCLLPLQVIQSDKGAFDKKEAIEQRDQLIANTALVVSSGESLINVFWKKANDNVVRSIVKVFYYHRPNSGDAVQYLICEKETESCYLSLTGLAYGEYRCVVEEHSSKGIIIAVEGYARLVDPVKVMKEESKEIKEHLKGVGRAAVGHTVVI